MVKWSSNGLTSWSEKISNGSTWEGIVNESRYWGATGNASERNKGRTFFLCVFEQVFVFQKKCAWFLRNSRALSFRNHDILGKSSKFLIVRLIFTSTKCRYSWKHPFLSLIEVTVLRMLETDVNVSQWTFPLVEMCFSPPGTFIWSSHASHAQQFKTVKGQEIWLLFPALQYLIKCFGASLGAASQKVFGSGSPQHPSQV